MDEEREEQKIWYISVNNQKDGPFSIEELSKRRLCKNALMWKRGMVSWLRADDVPDFKKLLSKELPSEEIEGGAKRQSESTISESEAYPQVSKRQKWIHDESLKYETRAIITLIVVLMVTIFFAHPIALKQQKEAKFAAMIAQKEREFREERGRRERMRQELADSLLRAEAEERDRKKVLQDSLARARTRTQAGQTSSRGQFFTDPRDGRMYKIKQFESKTWFLENLGGGKGYTWPEAVNACPKGWHLPANREWRSLSLILGDGAGRFFDSRNSWWCSGGWENREGIDIWYLSGGSLVNYSSSSNKSAVYAVRCVKD
ncbi:MAG: GYF domain-containing protein [Chitinispirillales bacterium]|jgi:hypothetical protein|nr:GYF domain-containing protein [Chitinispirillales bacterium]